jgi:endonuclease/exonuclease/phosphatase family metal-dependent hydrolase
VARGDWSGRPKAWLAGGTAELPSKSVTNTARSCAGRSGAAVAALCVVAACALVLCVSGCAGPAGTAAAALRRSGPAYTLMQMNLCLSGLAGCYARVHYPEGVEAAAAEIRQTHPDAVTFNEACGGDVAAIARQTGYHLRFSSIIYYGKRLPCIKPGGRGLFGDAVLTRTEIESSFSHPFPAEAGPEQRQWLCATTRVGVEVCTAHLASTESVEVAANAPQCAQLGALLAGQTAARAVIFGGDVNRLSSCAPHGFWTRTDASGHQDPGIQQIYGSAALRSPSARVLPAAHTDHDILFVHANLAR